MTGVQTCALPISDGHADHHADADRHAHADRYAHADGYRLQWTGAYGLEALSRGAASAVFAEADRAAYNSIRQNVEKLGLTRATILHRDAIQVLAEEVAAGRRYDLVLLDPPYRMFSSLQERIALYLPAVLAEDGLAVVETHAKEEPQLPLEKRTSRKYGSARLTLFEHQ